MASRRIFTTKGFTLIELLIVIGLITMVGSAFLFIDVQSYRGDAFRAERDMIVTLVGQTRLDALNNISEKPHGIAFFPSDAPESYVLFEGTTYISGASTNEYYPSNYEINLGPGAPSQIVFAQLSADSNFSGTITVVDPNRNVSTDIVINEEGGMSW